MILAETPSIPLDTLAGGGVTGMLVAVMYAFLKRTKDTDERRDASTTMAVETARQSEQRAWEERDKAIAERDEARAEAERIRAEARVEAERLRLTIDEERKRRHRE